MTGIPPRCLPCPKLARASSGEIERLLGDVPPAEFEAMYYERQESPAREVELN